MTISTQQLSLAIRQAKATQLRLRVLDQVQVAGSGHYGSSLSLAEILVSLYYGFLRVKPDDPNWDERDRLVLSKGHGCSALYAVLADIGFMHPDILRTFTRLGSILGDHPDMKKVPGIDFSAGSLGHGLSVAVGMAQAQRYKAHNSRVVVIHGDGEMNEGQVWEAAAYAGVHRLSNLLVIIDRNQVQVDGTTKETLNFEPVAAKWEAFNWHVEMCDGHDLTALASALAEYERRRRDSEATPFVLIANTIAGKGIDFIEGDAAWHVGYLHGPDNEEAVSRINAMYSGQRRDGVTNYELRSPQSFDSINTRRLAKQLVRVGRGLADLGERDERIVAASSDLKFSTLMSEFEERHPTRFYQFGISERNMIGAAAGMASCGLRPYVATFASFAGLLAYENIRTDLAYPNLPVRILATHSGISMGYFATSHHATEDISALRSVAGLTVLSPADGTATVEMITQTVDYPGPIYFRLSRGREESVYEVVPAEFRVGVPQRIRAGSDLLIVSTGLLVRNSVDAADLLAKDGISCSVLDVHTLKPFPDEAIAAAAVEHQAVLVVEEHNTEGGLGSMVQEALGAAGYTIPCYKHGLYDEFCIIGPPNHCYLYYGLDAGGIATTANRLMRSLPASSYFARSNVERLLWTEDDRSRVLKDVQNRNPRATRITEAG